MGGATKGQRRLSISMQAGLILAAGACGTNPPPTPMHPATVAGMMSCALSAMQAEGWQLGGQYPSSSPDAAVAHLVRGDETYSRVVLWVRRDSADVIRVGVVSGPGMANPTWADQMQQRIRSACSS